MFSTIWDCLDADTKLSLLLYQRRTHDKHWDPPSDKMSKSVPGVSVHYDHAEDIPAIMQATPEQVKHNQGVFREGKA